jgi:hypothetical protein
MLNTFFGVVAMYGQSAPVASFSPLPDTICCRTALNFTNLTTGNPDFQFWIVTGAISASPQATNPRYYFPSAGIYIIKLKAYWGTAVDSCIQSVYARHGPTLSLIHSNTVACCDNSPIIGCVSATVSGAPIFTWHPTLANTNTFYYVIPPPTGHYTIWVIGKDSIGCTDSVGQIFQRTSDCSQIPVGTNMEERVTEENLILVNFDYWGSSLRIDNISNFLSRYTISDVYGRDLMSGVVEGNNEAVIDVSNLRSGFSIVSIYSSHKVRRVKLLLAG